jgi:hypothetical protein
MMKTLKTYEPPCVEIITIETPCVLCGSSLSGGAKGMSTTSAMGASGGNSAIIM